MSEMHPADSSEPDSRNASGLSFSGTGLYGTDRPGSNSQPGGADDKTYGDGSQQENGTQQVNERTNNPGNHPIDNYYLQTISGHAPVHLDDEVLSRSSLFRLVVFIGKGASLIIEALDRFDEEHAVEYLDSRGTLWLRERYGGWADLKERYKRAGDILETASGAEGRQELVRQFRKVWDDIRAYVRFDDNESPFMTYLPRSDVP